MEKRFFKIKNQVQDIQKKSSLTKTMIDNTISSIDTLITRLRDIEEQIQNNIKQPIHEYEKLILDCHVSYFYTFLSCM